MIGVQSTVFDQLISSQSCCLRLRL